MPPISGGKRNSISLRISARICRDVYSGGRGGTSSPWRLAWAISAATASRSTSSNGSPWGKLVGIQWASHRPRLMSNPTPAPADSAATGAATIKAPGAPGGVVEGMKRQARDRQEPGDFRGNDE